MPWTIQTTGQGLTGIGYKALSASTTAQNQMLLEYPH